MTQQHINSTTWTTEKISLDRNIYAAELAPEGTLWLLNDAIKEELELSARGTYDLMIALHERTAQIYEATHRPKNLYTDVDPLPNYQIIAPTGNEGELQPPPPKTLYANAAEPYLAHILTVAEDWANDAYSYNARVVRVVPTETSTDTPEQIPDFLLKQTTWYYYDGKADQSWKVTIWPQSGWQSGIVDHLYVHRLGDVLITGGSESGYGSAVPRQLLLPIEDDEELDEE